MFHQPNASNRFSISSIRLMCEAAEIGRITDEAALAMSNQVTQVLRQLIGVAEKFSFHSKRRNLLTIDIDHALKTLNMKPILGFYCNDIIPFRFATGGGHKIYFHDDKEIELADVIARVSMPKLPQDVAIESHWLAIDGVQPAIPENPPPLTRDEQRLECIDPLEALNSNTWLGFTNRNLTGSCNTHVLKKHVETVQVKQMATHELSVEQQLYFKEITEACIGPIEQRRHYALNSLAHDPGLHQMLPRLCLFISEGVKVNVVHNNLALLIYLLRMVKSLLENQTLYLEKYLHELCPTVITCIVSKQICNRPEQENHYAIREFASRLLATICKNYNTSTNSLQTRITKLLCKALDNTKLPLSSVYGCISALGELGPEVQQTLLLRRLPAIQERLMPSSPNLTLADLSPTSPEGKILTLLTKKFNLHLPMNVPSQQNHHQNQRPQQQQPMTTV